MGVAGFSVLGILVAAPTRMDTFQHKGTTYVKASILAKRHRYTTDYIGQLCRGNKIDAQLVGRAWYVNEISLLSHKIDRKKDTRPNEILSKNSTEIVVSDTTSVKISVHPTLSKKTHRQFFSEELRPTALHNWQNRTVAYVGDSATLVPQVTNKIVKNLVEAQSSADAVTIPVDLVHPTKVEVKDVSQHNHKKHLTFTDLPEILLGGTVPILDLDSTADYAESEPVQSDDLPKLEPNAGVSAAKVARYQKPVRSSYLAPRRVDVAEDRQGSRAGVVLAGPEAQMPLPASKPVRSHFEARIATEPAVRTTSHFVVPLLFILSFLLTSLSLAFSSITVYENGAVERSFSFQTSSIADAFLYLTKQP